MSFDTARELKDLIPGLKLNTELKNHTTFKIGGKAKYFFKAQTEDELIGAVKAADKLKVPFYILGGGSKLLVSDKGFEGFIIKVKNSNFEVKNSRIWAESGLTLQSLVEVALREGLSGIEWAKGIPSATVGGAVRGNAGAFGKSMKDIVRTVTVFDVDKNKVLALKNKDCDFQYRDNLFKKNVNLIILSCEMEFIKKEKNKIKQEMNGYWEHRKKAHPLNFPSAGSIFENPKKKSSKKGEIDVMIAGLLIRECGLAGKKIGGAKISEKHSNFIINVGDAKEKDVKELIKLIKQKVKEKFKVDLYEELQFVENKE
jgi:UDP-N-acetylmuramate dehydrogenase